MSTAGTELDQMTEAEAPEVEAESQSLPALSPETKKLARILTATVLIALSLMCLGLLSAWGSRVCAPTRRGWTCFPVSRQGLICQNIRSWYRGRSYGRRECLDALVEAAKHVRERMSHVKVAYMDASDANGGKFLAHRSHRDGVDVDVLFIGRTWNGSPYPTQPAIFTTGYDLKYNRTGRHDDVTFDPDANWLFIEGLHDQKVRRVEAIFVEPYIREWLLKAGKEMNAPKEVRQWAASVLAYAGDRAGDHKDHFHVRFEK